MASKRDTPDTPFRSYFCLLNHLQNLVGGSHARHPRKNKLHQGVVGALVMRGATGIPHDDHVVVQISAGVNRGRYAYIGGATGNDQGVDVARTKGEI